MLRAPNLRGAWAYFLKPKLPRITSKEKEVISLAIRIEITNFEKRLLVSRCVSNVKRGFWFPLRAPLRLVLRAPFPLHIAAGALRPRPLGCGSSAPADSLAPCTFGYNGT